jgi:hypothetical protein
MIYIDDLPDPIYILALSTFNSNTIQRRITFLLFVIRSRFDLNQSERVIVIYVVCFAGMGLDLKSIEVYVEIIIEIFEVLFLICFLNFINIQIFVINILMYEFVLFSLKIMKKKTTSGIILVTDSILVLIDVSILLLNLHGNKWIVIICLVPLIIHINILVD